MIVPKLNKKKFKKKEKSKRKNRKYGSQIITLKWNMNIHVDFNYMYSVRCIGHSSCMEVALIKTVESDGRADTVTMNDKWWVNYMWSKIPRIRDLNEDIKVQ